MAPPADEPTSPLAAIALGSGAAGASAGPAAKGQKCAKHTFERKNEFRDFLQAHPNLSVAKNTQAFNALHKVSISSSTASDWVKAAPAARHAAHGPRQEAQGARGLTRARVRVLRRPLHLWVIDKGNQQGVLTHAVLIDKAQQLGLGVRGWLGKLAELGLGMRAKVRAKFQ